MTRRSSRRRWRRRRRRWRSRTGPRGCSAASWGSATRRSRGAWRAYRVQPWRSETFKFSTDPELEAKVSDVVGLYLDPPERAIVLSVDEKTQIQALDRTQPMLPLRPGQVERHTHDYKRNGTTSLFAALEVATGTVTTEPASATRRADFLAFLRQSPGPTRAAGPRRARQRATHKTRDVQAWLARHPRFTLPLHADQRVLDEPGRDLVRHPHPPGHPAGQLRERPRPHGAIERFTREYNGAATVHLGQDRRRDPRQR